MNINRINSATNFGACFDNDFKTQLRAAAENAYRNRNDTNEKKQLAWKLIQNAVMDLKKLEPGGTLKYKLRYGVLENRHDSLYPFHEIYLSKQNQPDVLIHRFVEKHPNDIYFQHNMLSPFAFTTLASRLIEYSTRNSQKKNEVLNELIG